MSKRFETFPAWKGLQPRSKYPSAIPQTLTSGVIMKRLLLVYGLLALMTIALAGCGAGSMSSNSQSGGATQAAVFVTGEDAPVSSVVAFNITIDKITLNNGSNTVTALSTPVAVD